MTASNDEVARKKKTASSSGVQAKRQGSDPNRERDEAAVLAHINPTGLSDVPTEEDSIGFHPYVRAVAWFLSNDKTKPPLTISIEGPWGSGKSSFMLQLERELKAQYSGKHKQYYIKFNAWRSDKDEALWAAFALTFIKQLEPQIDLHRRVWANVGLLWRRFEGRRGWLQLARLAIFAIALLILTIYALCSGHITDPTTKTVVVGIPWLAAVYFGLEKAKKIFGNPLSYDLSKYVRNLRYEDKVAFIDRFQDDFADIVKSYVGEDGRVFIFIDDLDRCEVPRAAELLQAINLLLSADQGNLFFILGLDREMVSAGIAAKNEKILPYLAAGRPDKGRPASPEKEKTDFYGAGIEYGYNFMEKFVQVAFRVPRPDDREITQWVSKMIEPTPTSEIPPRGQNPIDIRAGSDPDGFEEVVEKIARLFEFNPRRIKQFVNVFRLRLMVALSTGVLTAAPQNVRAQATARGITIHQVGLFTALLMRWSRLAGDLAEEPALFDKLASGEPQTGVAAKWMGNNELRNAIRLDEKYDLSNVDLTPLLIIMPDAYSGRLGEQDPTRGRTRLVGGFRWQPDATADANTSPRVDTGRSATISTSGPTGPIPIA